jgi:hypothetical protein
VIEVLGPEWLDDGWGDVTLRRPLFAGEEVTITVSPSGTVAASVGSRVVLDGSVGLGAAAWADELDPPPPGPATDPPFVRPTYTVSSAPVGEALRPLGAYVTAAAARRLALEDLGQTRSQVPEDRLHPWFLAARMAPLTRHNFTYGPTIHVRTQIQHTGPAAVDQEVVIGARIVEVYERNDHWYQVLDGLVVGGAGRPGGAGGPGVRGGPGGAGGPGVRGGPGAPELARLRHHSIFRPRGTTMPPPITGDPLA